MLISLLKCDCLFHLLWSDSCQIATHVLLSVIPSARRQTVCLHHAGPPSAAVLLFYTPFIDHIKRSVFHIPPSLSLILFSSLWGLIKLSCEGLSLLPAYSSLQCNDYQTGSASHACTQTHTCTQTCPLGEGYRWGGGRMSLIINKENQ